MLFNSLRGEIITASQPPRLRQQPAGTIQTHPQPKSQPKSPLPRTTPPSISRPPLPPGNLTPANRTPVAPAILRQIQALRQQLSEHQAYLKPLPLSLSAICRQLDESTSEVKGSMNLLKLHLKELNQTTAQIPVIQAELVEIKVLLKKAQSLRHSTSKARSNGSWNANWKHYGMMGLMAFTLCMATAAATLYWVGSHTPVPVHTTAQKPKGG